MKPYTVHLLTLPNQPDHLLSRLLFSILRNTLKFVQSSGETSNGESGRNRQRLGHHWTWAGGAVVLAVNLLLFDRVDGIRCSGRGRCRVVEYGRPADPT